MKNLLLLLFCFSFIQFSFAQSDWQEHLSHDRRAYTHYGHYVVDGEIVLLMGNVLRPMNTLETISGNTKKTQEIIRDGFTFDSKTTRTGIDSKEILLMNSYDYDIPGFGAYSIYERDNTFTNRNTQLERINNVYIQIHDAFMSGTFEDPKQCVINENRHVFLNSNDDIEMIQDLEKSFRFHEGLSGDVYHVSDGVFTNADPTVSESIDLGDFDKLYNDPFKNQVIELEENVIYRYSYTDLNLISTELLVEDPIDLQFVENGFYYLIETEDDYIVYFYSDIDLTSIVYYEMLKSDEVIDFDIRNFEVIENDIYFFGLWKSLLINRRFSYVQKRTIGQDFTPNRKDLELTSAHVTREEIEDNKHIFFYDLTLTNLGTEPINHFTIYTNELYDDFGPMQYIKLDIEQSIEPGESYDLEGDFTLNYGAPNKLTFNIEGVDFGLDSDYTNNEFTVDVIILSNHTTGLKQFNITPNLSANFLKLNGNVAEIKSMTITNIKGNRVDITKIDERMIDITSLPNGQYWLEIKTTNTTEQHPFTKI